MKLTRTEVREKREALAATLGALSRLRKDRKSLIAALDEDIRDNEAVYRNGIPTSAGVLTLRMSNRFYTKRIIAA